MYNKNPFKQYENGIENVRNVHKMLKMILLIYYEKFERDSFENLCEINTLCALREAAACNKFYSLSVRLGFSLHHAY